MTCLPQARRPLVMLLGLIVALVADAPVAAQSAARPDKIMTISELRVCMKMKQVNDASAAEILQAQQSFACCLLMRYTVGCPR